MSKVGNSDNRELATLRNQKILEGLDVHTARAAKKAQAATVSDHYVGDSSGAKAMQIMLTKGEIPKSFAVKSSEKLTSMKNSVISYVVNAYHATLKGIRTGFQNAKQYLAAVFARPAKELTGEGAEPLLAPEASEEISTPKAPVSEPSSPVSTSSSVSKGTQTDVETVMAKAKRYFTKVIG